MGRAKRVDPDIIQISFQESVDTAAWDGVVFLSNGTMKVERIEGLEVVSPDGVVIDNQASSYFVLQKSENPLDVVQEAKQYEQARESADGLAPKSSSGACTYGMKVIQFLFFLSPIYTLL